MTALNEPNDLCRWNCVQVRSEITGRALAYCALGVCAARLKGGALACSKKLGKKTPSGETSTLYLHKYDFLLLPFVRNTHTDGSSSYFFCYFWRCECFSSGSQFYSARLDRQFQNFQEFTDFALSKVSANTHTHQLTLSYFEV
jgi:hypothetical protein